MEDSTCCEEERHGDNYVEGELLQWQSMVVAAYLHSVTTPQCDSVRQYDEIEGDMNVITTSPYPRPLNSSCKTRRSANAATASYYANPR